MKFIFFLFTPILFWGQFYISGQIDTAQWQPYVYISAIENYRHIESDLSELLIAKIKTDESGNFEFTSQQFPDENKIYKIHIANCSPDENQYSDLTGKCDNVQSIFFIAHNKDSIHIPLSLFQDVSLCNMESSNQHTQDFLRIDSLKNSALFSIFDPKKDKEKTINKYYRDFISFGNKMEEPLSRLMIYQLISDKTSVFYDTYLSDLSKNKFYQELLDDLEEKYPASNYTRQYRIELASDNYASSLMAENKSISIWFYVLIAIILGLFVWIFFLLKKLKNKGLEAKPELISLEEVLTPQEQKIAGLITENKSNKEIADELFISLNTVKTHINNIYKKLNISERKELKSKIHTGV